MSIAKSIFLGSHGNYNIGGFDVEFTNGAAYSFAGNSCVTRAIGKIAEAILSNSVIRCLTLGNLHTLVHEMGHAVVSKWLDSAGRYSQIRIFTNSGTGETALPNRGLRVVDNLIIFDTPSWHQDLVLLAGPMADMLFSVSKLVLAVALKSYISLPVATILAAGSLLYMSGELLYATYSVINQDAGDFGSIARSGAVPLFIATAALVGTFALGSFGAVTLW
jgi:hypothetical protein